MSKILGPAFPRFTGFRLFFKEESAVLKSCVTAFLGASEYSAI
jgi:glucan biosynthesis protein